MEPINLTNLRSMTDGDVEMEKELFEEFYSSFEFGIQVLKNCNQHDDIEGWRKKAHALKGIAMSLGAETLGEYCHKAQVEFSVDQSQKQQMLDRIGSEYQTVREYLCKIS